MSLSIDHFPSSIQPLNRLSVQLLTPLTLLFSMLYHSDKLARLKRGKRLISYDRSWLIQCLDSRGFQEHPVAKTSQYIYLPLTVFHFLFNLSEISISSEIIECRSLSLLSMPRFLILLLLFLFSSRADAKDSNESLLIERHNRSADAEIIQERVHVSCCCCYLLMLLLLFSK